MDDLIKCLYEFTWAHRMSGLQEDEEYKTYTHDVKLQQELVESHLTEEQRKELRWLIDAVTFQDSIVNEHIFRAALGLSRELSTLVGA